MGYKAKKRKSIRTDPINRDVLFSIGSPNAWTPEREDSWIAELRKLSVGEIYRFFPPLKKPPTTRKRGKSFGYGG
jgi:hypothetical protein